MPKNKQWDYGNSSTERRRDNLARIYVQTMTENLIPACVTLECREDREEAGGWGGAAKATSDVNAVSRGQKNKNLKK